MPETYGGVAFTYETVAVKRWPLLAFMAAVLAVWYIRFNNQPV